MPTNTEVMLNEMFNGKRLGQETESGQAGQAVYDGRLRLPMEEWLKRGEAIDKKRQMEKAGQSAGSYAHSGIGPQYGRGGAK